MMDDKVIPFPRSASGAPTAEPSRDMPAEAEEGTPAPKGRKMPPCPVCGQPSDPKARPFCSARCANVDLGRWLNGSYAIPVEEHGGSSDEEE